ncbi:hypothetical protein F5880DRAFT_1619455 [Lentinula raphanica]|nr:hypothetical protein F5880DRAFT_1619455 [Lentinula raphanica]
MSTPPVSSLQLTEDQALFLITFINQHSHLLPPQRQNFPEILASQRRSSSRSSYNVRLQELERRERELVRRERELERRVRENANGLKAKDAPVVGGQNSPPVDDTLPSISSLSPHQSQTADDVSDRDPNGLFTADNVNVSFRDPTDDDDDEGASVLSVPNLLCTADNDSVRDPADDDDDEGTLVESDDFTDKWFQTQAEDLGEVEEWLALQVEALSIPPQVRKKTSSSP